jgi:hypothetical protein
MEISFVYSDNLKKHVLKICLKCSGFLNVITGGAYNNHYGLDV